ncbi:hypothetical protein LGH83_09280 [Lichenihabitans sp. PAMC28606]|uniref:hypothetical protein n=1 Tax=Lichenihabitans sp. PAMC28606 TaxID=2880932 RepID=UPI001D0A2444|nr:hypothetical protein [Lichenihabitans sp. PAMC28606]UDL96342.1 hypothetical protein LGH83_09280 [Lichenihabitans sp. PAMC28606]
MDHTNHRRPARAIAVAASQNATDRVANAGRVILALLGSVILLQAAVTAYHAAPLLQP